MVAPRQLVCVNEDQTFWRWQEETQRCLVLGRFARTDAASYAEAASEERQTCASRFFPATWNVNESRARSKDIRERDFLFEHGIHSVNCTVTRKNWEFWLIEFLPFLLLKFTRSYKKPEK